MFRSPERPTFVNSDQSRQKHHLKPRGFQNFRARYRAYRFVTACHTFAKNFLFRFDKRIVSAPAPLPLTGAEKESLQLTCGPSGTPAPTEFFHTCS